MEAYLPMPENTIILHWSWLFKLNYPLQVGAFKLYVHRDTCNQFEDQYGISWMLQDDHLTS